MLVWPFCWAKLKNIFKKDFFCSVLTVVFLLHRLFFDFLICSTLSLPCWAVNGSAFNIGLITVATTAHLQYMSKTRGRKMRSSLIANFSHLKKSYTPPTYLILFLAFVEFIWHISELSKWWLFRDVMIWKFVKKKTCTKMTFNVTSSRAPPSFNDSLRCHL